MNKAVPNREIAEMAADWAVRIDAGPMDASEREALARWLKASPAHIDELLYSASILASLENVDPDRALSIESLLARHAPEVIPLFPQSGMNAGSQVPESDLEPASYADSRAGSAALRWSALAAVLVLAVGVGLSVRQFGWGELSPSEVVVEQSDQLIVTDIGEQRSITLADGSVLYVNTNSKVHIALSETARRIELSQGEALFDVAHDESRPFEVLAGDAVIRAVGTKFNVKHTGQGLNVVVLEGAVIVEDRADVRGDTPSGGDSGFPSARLAAGQQAQLTPGLSRPVISATDPAAVTSWRTRQLTFEDQSLAAIADEFNRYNRTRIVLADSEIADIRFSGVFSADDPQSFVTFLELSAGIRVDRSSRDEVVLTSGD